MGKIIAGTCLGLNCSLIDFLSRETKSSLNSEPEDSLQNRMTRSSDPDEFR
jgi:hypothetical protein